MGFEPTVESPPHRFSRPACSTAPAPLRTAEDQSIMLFGFGSHYREGNPMKRATKSAAKLVVLENYDRISAETEEIRNRIRERAFPLSQERGPQRRRRLSSTGFGFGEEEDPLRYCVRTSRNGTERTVPPLMVAPPPPAPPPPPPDVAQEEMLIRRAITSFPLRPSRKIAAKPMTCTVALPDGKFPVGQNPAVPQVSQTGATTIFLLVSESPFGV